MKIIVYGTGFPYISDYIMEIYQRSLYHSEEDHSVWYWLSLHFRLMEIYQRSLYHSAEDHSVGDY